MRAHSSNFAWPAVVRPAGHLPLRRLNVHLHHSLQVRDRNGQVPKEYQVCGTPSQGGSAMVEKIDMGIPGYLCKLVTAYTLREVAQVADGKLRTSILDAHGQAAARSHRPRSRCDG